MSGKLAVYSPCVSELRYSFDSKPRVLLPGAVTLMRPGEARLVVERFGEFGVCLYNNHQGDDIRKAARIVWEQGNKKWAESVLLEWHRATKEQREAGIEPDEPSDVKIARSFLKEGRPAPPPEPPSLVEKAKKKIKGGAAVIALLLLASPLMAQQQVGPLKSANFAYKYDVASTTITYCKTTGINGNPFGEYIPGPGRIETAGSSTTITGVNSSSTAVFADVGAGDLIHVRTTNGTIYSRVVVTNADDDTITVDTAIDLTNGAAWSYKTLSCGITDDDGWIPMSGYSKVMLTVSYDAGDLTTLSAVWECRGGADGASVQRIYPGPSSTCGDGTLNGTVCEFSAVGDSLAYEITDNLFSYCRLGVAYVTADGATRDEVTTAVDVGR